MIEALIHVSKTTVSITTRTCMMETCVNLECQYNLDCYGWTTESNMGRQLEQCTGFRQDASSEEW